VAPHDLQVDLKTIVWEAYLVACILQFKNKSSFNGGTTTVCKGQGLTNAAIAERLVLSPKTVRNYISEIYSKLQVADRVQAMLRARESGLG
jgi:Bacterial regulatory proteins, luxR family